MVVWGGLETTLLENRSLPSAKEQRVQNLQPIIYIVIGLLLIGLVFRIIRGAIRLVFSLVIIAVVIYLVLNVLR